ncbi:MAG: hypothetical protein L0154_18005 [Chloroflexi bacterium]|nr:hypothetical protein [Chloroflexota bacterium]
MDCITNNPLSDEQIHDVIMGNASPEIIEHIKQCEFCAERVHEARVMPALARLLYRAKCPSSDELRNYHFDLVDPETNEVVNKHLKLCRFCRQDLQEMIEFIEAEEPRVELPTFDITAPNFMFAKPASGERVALRGGSSVRGVDSGPLMFEAQTATIFLDLETTAKGYILRGQVMDQDDMELWSEATVEIWQDGYQIDTIQADDMGSFDYLLEEAGMIDIHVIATDKTSIIISDIEYKD